MKQTARFKYSLPSYNYDKVMSRVKPMMMIHNKPPIELLAQARKENANFIRQRTIQARKFKEASKKDRPPSSIPPPTPSRCSMGSASSSGTLSSTWWITPSPQSCQTFSTSTGWPSFAGSQKVGRVFPSSDQGFYQLTSTT